LVRFATNTTHKKPAVGVGSRRRGSLPTLFTTLQPRGQCDVPPRSYIQLQSRFQVVFQRQRERPPNGQGTRCDRAFFQRNALYTGAPFYLDLTGQLGGCNPGDASHSLMCEPVSACRAFRISSSRAAPGGSCKASSRSRFASCPKRTSGVDWMILILAMLVSQSMHRDKNVQRWFDFRQGGRGP